MKNGISEDVKAKVIKPLVMQLWMSEFAPPDFKTDGMSAIQPTN